MEKCDRKYASIIEKHLILVMIKLPQDQKNHHHFFENAPVPFILKISSRPHKVPLDKKRHLGLNLKNHLI